MNFKEGRNDCLYLGKKILVYKQKVNQKLGMISASGNPVYKAVQTIDKIDDARIHYCKVNCNYFDLNTHQHYGPEVTPQAELLPRETGYLALYQKKDTKKIEYCNSTEYWLSRNAVEFVCCPFAVLFQDGKEVSDRSVAFPNKLEQANTQTFLLQFQDMSCALCVCTGGLSPKQCLFFAKQYENLIHMSVYDSGGSTQMIIDGSKILYTGRAIPNVFTFHEGDSLPEDPDQESGILISTGDVKLNIREQPVTGKVLATVGMNESLEILNFLEGFQSDGYQWAKVKWNGIEGYSQIDTAYTTLKEKRMIENRK